MCGSAHFTLHTSEYQTSRFKLSTLQSGAEDHSGPLCLSKRAAWWAARLCSSILLSLPSAERSVSVGDGPTIEVISLISASIVACHIINVHLFKKKKKLWPLPRSFCHFLSAGFFCPPLSVALCLHTALPSSRCILPAGTDVHAEKDGETDRSGTR